MISENGLSIVDGATGECIQEKIWGRSLIEFLYANQQCIPVRAALRYLAAKLPIASRLWGKWHDLPMTAKKVAPFCAEYGINTEEFEQPLSSFTSFNDFFTRTLRPECRPISNKPGALIAPADARYTFIPNLTEAMPFTVKGTRFNLPSFLQCRKLAEKYEGGALIIARLCPIDCHRFVFPASGTIISQPKTIAGSLYSVSPLATGRLPWIWWENKRVLTELRTKTGLDFCMFEVGATNCGSIVQTFSTEKTQATCGEEKGYFRLGGSAILMLFPKGGLTIDHKLFSLQTSNQSEVYCRYGAEIGKCLSTVARS